MLTCLAVIVACSLAYGGFEQFMNIVDLMVCLLLLNDNSVFIFLLITYLHHPVVSTSSFVRA